MTDAMLTAISATMTRLLNRRATLWHAGTTRLHRLPVRLRWRRGLLRDRGLRVSHNAGAG